MIHYLVLRVLFQHQFAAKVGLPITFAFITLTTLFGSVLIFLVFERPARRLIVDTFGQQAIEPSLPPALSQKAG